MGFTDKIKSIFGKKSSENDSEEKQKSDVEKKTENSSMIEVDENAKYKNEECALCGNPFSEKKWAGQYWHKKCMRKARSGAKGMLKGMG